MEHSADSFWLMTLSPYNSKTAYLKVKCWLNTLLYIHTQIHNFYKCSINSIFTYLKIGYKIFLHETNMMQSNMNGKIPVLLKEKSLYVHKYIWTYIHQIVDHSCPWAGIIVRFTFLLGNIYFYHEIFLP